MHRKSNTVKDSPQYGKFKLNIQIVMGLGFLSKFIYLFHREINWSERRCADVVTIVLGIISLLSSESLTFLPERRQLGL